MEYKIEAHIGNQKMYGAFIIENYRYTLILESDEEYLEFEALSEGEGSLIFKTFIDGISKELQVEKSKEDEYIGQYNEYVKVSKYGIKTLKIEDVLIKIL